MVELNCPIIGSAHQVQVVGRQVLHRRCVLIELLEHDERLIALPLNLTTIEAAAGIYDVINSKMSDLIRRQVVRAGHVPEEYVIYAFGGAGPVHAAAYGAELGAGQELRPHIRVEMSFQAPAASNASDPLSDHHRAKEGARSGSVRVCGSGRDGGR